MNYTLPKIEKLDSKAVCFYSTGTRIEILVNKINELIEHENERNEESAKEICGTVYDPKFPNAYIPAGEVSSSADLKVCQNPKGECTIHDRKRCARCNNYFENHHIIHNFCGKKYHTGCYKKII